MQNAGAQLESAQVDIRAHDVGNHHGERIVACRTGRIGVRARRLKFAPEFSE